MKRTLLLAAAFAVVLISCEERKTHSPVPLPTPRMEPPPAAPPPSPTPEPSPLASPVARLAPEGILYVVEEISLTTEHGIHRLAAGKEVVVLEEKGDRVRVRDGNRETEAPRHYFTRDMDLRDSLLEQRAREQQAARTAAEQKKALFEAQQEVLRREGEASNEQWRQSRRATQQEELKQSLSLLNTRIARAEKERAEKEQRRTVYLRSYRGDGYYSYGERRSRAVSFSPDASQLDALITQRDALNAQLRRLEAER